MMNPAATLNSWKQKAPGLLRRLQLLSVHKWIITPCKNRSSVSFDFYWLSRVDPGYISRIWITRGCKHLRSSAFSTSNLCPSVNFSRNQRHHNPMRWLMFSGVTSQDVDSFYYWESEGSFMQILDSTSSFQPLHNWVQQPACAST